MKITVLFFLLLGLVVAQWRVDLFRVHGREAGTDCFSCRPDPDIFSECMGKKEALDLQRKLEKRQNEGLNFVIYRWTVEICLTPKTANETAGSPKLPPDGQ